MAQSEKIRVLIVDDIQETRENIRRMLQFEPRVEVIGGAKNGTEAIELSSKEQPDVVIMDINMPDMDGIAATEAIRKKVSFVQIVILSVQADPSYMRRAMLAGARDFLTKPPMIDELMLAVRRAGDMAIEEKSKAPIPFTVPAVGGIPGGNGTFHPQLGKIISVYSPKGGTGCSVLATNLAAALHTENTPVILVDGNFQFGDVAVMLNEQVKNSIQDLASHIDELDPDFVREIATVHNPTGFHILACPPQVDVAMGVTGDQFAKLLKYLATIYAFVIVDAASYLTETVQVALEYSDHILLITTQEIPSIKSCNLFLTLAADSGLRDRITFVTNRFDKRITITPEKIGEILHQPVDFVVPFEEKIVINSVNRGIPFVEENRTYPISKLILNLAELFHAQPEEVNAASDRSTFLRK
jgi:pilus assembly protein CpaE